MCFLFFGLAFPGRHLQFPWGPADFPGTAAGPPTLLGPLRFDLLIGP